MSAAVASKNRLCCQQRGGGLSGKDHMYCSPKWQDANRNGSTVVTKATNVTGQGQTYFISQLLDGQFDIAKRIKSRVIPAVRIGRGINDRWLIKVEDTGPFLEDLLREHTKRVERITAALRTIENGEPIEVAA